MNVVQTIVVYKQQDEQGCTSGNIVPASMIN